MGVSEDDARLARLSLKGDIKGALPAVMTLGRGKPGDDGADGGIGQPVRRAATQDSLSHPSLARDDQHRPGAIVIGAQKKGVQHGPSAILIQPMQVESGGDILPPAPNSPFALRFYGLGWSVGLRLGRRRLSR